jgi:hypothetical protein
VAVVTSGGRVGGGDDIRIVVIKGSKGKRQAVEKAHQTCAHPLRVSIDLTFFRIERSAFS